MTAPTARHPWGWATLAPLACAVHCLAGPLLVAVLPVALFSETVEWGLFLLTVIFAAMVLGSGTRVHRRWGPWLIAAPGILLWGSSLGELLSPLPEEVGSVTGALFVAGALLRNTRLRCLATEGHCHACEMAEADGKTDSSRLNPPGKAVTLS